MNGFFTSLKGYIDSTVLPASGSHRIYSRIRLADNSAPEGVRTIIGVENESSAENASFIALDRHLVSRGVRVPRVYDVSADGLCYTQDDLGDVSLHDCLDNKPLLLQVMGELPRIQFGAKDFDWSKCFATREFGPRIINFDLNYFKYCFLRISGVLFDENRLQDDFDRLCTDLVGVPSETFLYRDFQSRNIMVYDGNPWYIDFQGGFKGPFYYDLCSFIYHASSAFSQSEKDELKEAYYVSLRDYANVGRIEFEANVRKFALLRIMQALGAYGFRGLVEKKQYFADCIPAGIRNLQSVACDRYPYLKSLSESLL